MSPLIASSIQFQQTFRLHQQIVAYPFGCLEMYAKPKTNSQISETNQKPLIRCQYHEPIQCS